MCLWRVPRGCYRKVEPGVYLQEFGVRSEVNMLVRSGKAESNW